MTKKYFGTDGIRGRVGTYPITPKFVMKLGWAAGKVFAKQGKSRILIGKDTRISGYMFESALEAGLSAAGVDVGLLGPMPTPGIAYLTRTFHADAGIVISASHNSFEDNGIKFFSGDGAKLPDDIETQIEYMLDQEMDCVESELLGKAKRIDDAAGRYIEFCKSSIGGMSLSGIKVVLDCANGATYNIAPEVFNELGAETIVTAAKPDGLNINLACGSTHPRALQQRVLAEKADIGIAFDGDGDRVVMVDHKGEVVDGDEILFVITRYLAENDLLQGGVAGTLMTNLGFELALKDMGVPFCRTNVGDRYVMQALKENNWRLGGESSGHILCLDQTTTGDGIISALQVLRAMASSRLSLSEIKQGMKKMPQKMINVRLPRKVDVSKDPSVLDAVAQAEAKMAGKGRVLLRASGTEPVIRVMVEGESAALVADVAEDIAAVVEQAVA
jgi:phosphoglucosamine mutase